MAATSFKQEQLVFVEYGLAGSSPRSTSFVVQQPLKQDLSSRAEWDLTQAEKVHYNEDESESEEDDDSTGYAYVLRVNHGDGNKS